jgi:hypothetical protein
MATRFSRATEDGSSPDLSLRRAFVESRPWGLFSVRGSKAPRNDAFELAAIIRFDQGSTESLPTTN